MIWCKFEFEKTQIKILNSSLKSSKEIKTKSFIYKMDKIGGNNPFNCGIRFTIVGFYTGL
jgi:hypothetical protein